MFRNTSCYVMFLQRPLLEASNPASLEYVAREGFEVENGE